MIYKRLHSDRKVQNMKVKRYMAVCGICVFIIGSLSGCAKEENHISSNQSEQALKQESKETDTGEQTEKEKIQEKNKQDNKNTENEHTTKTEPAEPEKITVDYTKEFQGIWGCAVLYDTSKNQYSFYQEEQCNVQASPYSTFKIVSALMGLHNQVITSEESKMGYSGAEYPMKAWNADLSFKEAFQNSCVWYFRKIIDQIGQEEVQKELTALKYGNCDSSEWNGSKINSFPELNGFWLDSSLKISPLEQVNILRNIMEGKTMYTKEEVAVLKSVMQVSDNSWGKLYGKTGTGTNGEAWFVGFLEKENNNIYVAIYLNDSNANEISGAKAKEIAEAIFQTSR